MRTKGIMIGTGALAIGLLVLNLMSSPVYGQPRNADTTQAMAGFTFGLLSPRLLNALNLTPDQVTKIEAQKKALTEANKAFVTEVTALRKEVADKLYGPNPATEADVAPQITKIADAREKILREGFRIALEVRHVLRPDQLAKAATIRQQLLEIQNEVRGLFNENQ
jgi:Spy/CpxP family protein refolding chaperone